VAWCGVLDDANHCSTLWSCAVCCGASLPTSVWTHSLCRAGASGSPAPAQNPLSSRYPWRQEGSQVSCRGGRSRACGSTPGPVCVRVCVYARAGVWYTYALITPCQCCCMSLRYIRYTHSAACHAQPCHLKRRLDDRCTTLSHLQDLVTPAADAHYLTYLPQTATY
jgi:hypothetical protein